MTQDYQKTWEAMNSLESVASKICSAREILDSAIESLESGNRQKTETLLYAVDEFLQYYLEDFDRKFETAWNETVVKLKEEDPCMPPWGHSDLEYVIANPTLTEDRISNFPGEQYTEETLNAMCDAAEKQEKDKVKRWVLPVEEVENGDTGEQEYFITFPDDLLESANLKEEDQIEWIDQGDGSYLLKKIENQMNYNEAVAAGWTMTADGFWIKE
jgi:hypothetical protein